MVISSQLSIYKFLLSNTVKRMNNQSYKDALKALNGLQTNAEAIQRWEHERKLNKELDIKSEMDHYFSRMNLNPKKELSIIHLAGTKGKGSTCAFAESILRHNGYTTGLYSSPHLVSVRERIRLNGKPISEDLFAKHFWELWNQLNESKTESSYPKIPGYFRFMTLLAFRVFALEKVDVAVIETGVGGRTDATNIREGPVVCGITSLGYDHMNVLGNTLTEIAFEKAGIFKTGVPAYTVPQVPEAMNSLQKQANLVFKKSVPVVQPLVMSNVEVLGIEGEHNKINASIAAILSTVWIQQSGNKRQVTIPKIEQKVNLEGVEEISIEYDKLPKPYQEGLNDISWPGRSQIIALPKYLNTTFHLDGAHTPESLEACRKWFANRTKDNNVTKVLVFNCSNARDPNNLFRSLIHGDVTFDHVVFSTNDTGKDHILEDRRHEPPPSSWQESLRKTWCTLNTSLGKEVKHTEVSSSIPDFLEKLDKIREQDPSRPVQVLITGSFYLVGAFLELLQPELCDNV